MLEGSVLDGMLGQMEHISLMQDVVRDLQELKVQLTPIRHGLNGLNRYAHLLEGLTTLTDQLGAKWALL